MKSVQAALLGVLLLPVAARAAPEKSFAELLPDDTVAYLEINPLTADELKRAVAYKAMAEPGLRRVLDRMLGEEGNFGRAAVPLGQATLRAAMDIRESGLGFELAYAHGKVTHELKVDGRMAFACVGFGRYRETRAMPDLVALMTVENDPADAHALVRAVLLALAREMDRKPPDVRAKRFREWKHRDRACTSVKVGPAVVHVATVGRRIVIANRKHRLVDVIDRALTKPASSLATAARHRDALQHATGDGTVTALLEVDVKGGMRQLAAAHPAKFGQIATAAQTFGLGGLEGIVSVTRVDGDGVAGSTSVLLRGPRRGVARLFEKAAPAKLKCLEFAPAKTLYVAAGRFDGKGLYQSLLETAQPMALFLAGLAQEHTGVNIYDDLLKRLGPEAALIVSLNEGLIPDVGLVFESDDPERLRKTVLRMLSHAPWKRGTGVHATRLGGVDAHVVKLFHPQGFDLPIAPTFGIVDGHFVIALYPISFQRFVATKRGESASIEANRDFAALRERIPAEALSISYLDVRRGVGLAYDSLMPILQAMPQQDGGMPIYEFPESSAFSKHLYGRIAWRVSDDRGMHWHSFSSTDVGSVVLGFAAVLGGITVAVAREEAPPQVVGEHPPPVQVASAKSAEAYLCEANVRRIRNMLRPLARRRRPFPDRLEDLKNRRLDARTLTVPGTNGEKYVYLGPDGKNGILLAGRPNGPDGCVCVLTTDLLVKRISPADLQALLGRK